jgi:DDE_Tnp_1-associated
MNSTALTIAAPTVSEEEQKALLKPVPLVSFYQAFAIVPDPRSRHGLRYDLPYLLTCMVAALLCNCNSSEAVGQWCHDHEARLACLLWAARFLYADELAVSSSFTALRRPSH